MNTSRIFLLFALPIFYFLSACGASADPVQQQTAIAPTLIALAAHQATLNAVIAATQTYAALPTVSAISHNADWTPQFQAFDGVDMALVPPGCFDLGSDVYSITGSNRGGHLCYDTPFWIDKYEVTQAQFARRGGVAANPISFPGANRPRETITWIEALTFCQLRGARMPTEAEWEYAARGPDDWFFPWGNDFDPSRVFYNRDRSQATANVGSLPAGASWVGALDMSGNVWEWTSSGYDPYPYNAADGREDIHRIGFGRVFRGGSWGSTVTVSLRASTRTEGSLYYWDWNRDLGLRCARDY